MPSKLNRIKRSKHPAKRSIPAPKNPAMSNRYGDAQILKAVIAARGLVSLAADKLGCNRKTIWDRRNANPVIDQAIKEQRELFVDKAERGLMGAVEDREGWAICFALKTIGRDRGYIEQPHLQQVTVVQQNGKAAEDEDPFTQAARAIAVLVKQGILSPQLLTQLEAPIEVGGSNGAVNGSAER